jgi:hypothetical protein
MARTSSATKKQEDKPKIEITLTRSKDWVSYVADHPALAGHTYLGRNESEAMMNAANDISRQLGSKAEHIKVRVED